MMEERLSLEVMARHMLRTHGDHAALLAAMRADFWLERGNAERDIWWGKVCDLIKGVIRVEPHSSIH